MEDRKAILKGVFQEFERINRSNGRIYPMEAFEKALKKIARMRRKSKIERICQKTDSM